MIYPFQKQFLKFVLVGFLNTAIYFGALNLFMVIFNIQKGTIYSIFIAISFVLSVINSYVLNKRWTFQKGNKFRSSEFSKFLVVSSISFFINVGTASFLNNYLGPQFGISSYFWANISAVAASIFTTFINFFGYKYLVFRNPS